VGGSVVTMRARSTAALSLIGALNCRMIGTAIPTVWPSASWNWPLTVAAGLTVVNRPFTGTAVPSRPTTDPAHMYSAS